jgi:hypothetical protein
MVDDLLARHRRRRHLDRRHREGLGAAQPLDQAVEPPFVHQEADRAAVHAEHRADAAAGEHLVEGVEEKAVAAEGDDQLRLVERHEGIALAEHHLGRLRRFGAGGDHRHPCVRLFHGPCC